MIKLNHEAALAAAKNWGKANRSDPHAARVALSHMRNPRLAIPSDYHVDWGKENRFVEGPNGPIEFSVDVPKNMKRP